mmetsp:Transcript_56296/g.163254  ORF Transcript_56296/g.163254 Transcript_56296/m.163254 type:complete len:704 (+) Transcript_56296:11-2122(+)
MVPAAVAAAVGPAVAFAMAAAMAAALAAVAAMATLVEGSTAMLLLALVILFPERLHDLLVRGQVADDAVVQMLAPLGQLLAERLDEEEVLWPTVPLLVQLQEGLDREGLDELENDADASDVEDQEDQPRAGDARDLGDHIREDGDVLAKEGHHPDAEGGAEVVEVQDIKALLLVLRLLQGRVGLVQEASPQLDAHRREEVGDDAEQGHDVLRGVDDIADRLHHQLHLLQALELFQDAQEPQQPQDVHVPLDVGAAGAGRQLVQDRGGQQEPSRHEVEDVRPQGGVVCPLYDAEFQAHLHNVDQGEGQLQVLHERRFRPVVQVVDAFQNHERQVEEEHVVHESVEAALVHRCSEPLEQTAVPQAGQVILHGRVNLSDPERILHHPADVEELRLVHEAAAIFIHRLEHDLRGLLRDGPHVRRAGVLPHEVQERRPGQILAVAAGLRQILEGLLDARNCLLAVGLLGPLRVPGVCSHERVEDQVQQQDMNDHQEDEPEDAGGPVLRVGADEAVHELVRGPRDEHGVQGCPEGVETAVHGHAVEVAFRVVEHDNRDPSEEDDGAAVEHGDGHELAEHRRDALGQLAHGGQDAQVACARDEGDPEVRPEEREQHAVGDLQHAHGKAEVDHGQAVVLDVDLLEVLELQLPFQEQLLGDDEDERDLQHDPPKGREVREVRQQNLALLHAGDLAPLVGVDVPEEVVRGLTP